MPKICKQSWGGEDRHICKIIQFFKILWEGYICKLSVFRKDICAEVLGVGGEERREGVEVGEGGKREEKRKV